MQTQTHVREASEEDAPRIHEVLARAFGQFEGRLDPPSGVLAETAASIRLKIGAGGALVCQVGDEVVGCALYEPKQDHLYVGRFGVLPDYRGRRIGESLLEAAEELARTRGYREVRMNVRLALSGLRAYYEGQGYVPIASFAHEGYDSPTYVQMRKLVDT